MVSGIGNEEDLTKLGIPVVANNPGVGKVLKDHISLNVRFAVKSQFAIEEVPLSDWKSFLTSYNLGSSGYFGAAEKSKIFQLFVSSSGNTSAPNIAISYIPSGSIISFGMALQHTYTKGWVRLESSNPFVAPVVMLHDPLDERDIDSFEWAIKFVRDLVTRPPLSEMIDYETSPGNLTPDQLRVWIAQNVRGWNHYTGTCPLGDASSVDAVVDTSLHVKNVTNLMVADNSVLLFTGNENTQSSAMVIGEIAAKLVLKG